VAILGPNGAGKTTFVRTIATLIEPSSGTLQVRESTWFGAFGGAP